MYYLNNLIYSIELIVGKLTPSIHIIETVRMSFLSDVNSFGYVHTL